MPALLIHMNLSDCASFRQIREQLGGANCITPVCCSTQKKGV